MIYLGWCVSYNLIFTKNSSENCMKIKESGLRWVRHTSAIVNTTLFAFKQEGKCHTNL